MLRFFILPLLAAGLLMPFPLPAQPHQNAWFRTTLSYQVREKIGTEAEFQHRRQNGFGNRDMLDKRLMYTLRTWIHYQYRKEVRFSVSPFAYFSHYRIIRDRQDEIAAPASEIRFSAAADLSHELSRRLSLLDRTALEYRVFDHLSAPLIRGRTRFGLRYDLLPSLRLSLYDELLLNLSGTEPHHVFDHDRIGLLLEYELSPGLKLDLGYLHVTRLPLNSSDKLKENNLMINLSCRLSRCLKAGLRLSPGARLSEGRKQGRENPVF
jgi:hypothetical protein